MYRKVFLGLTLLVLVFGIATPVSAHSPADSSRAGAVTFPVEASQVVSGSDSNASGECQGYLNLLRTQFDISCTHNVANATAAHIHRAPAGTNGPIVFFLDPGTTFTYAVNEQTLQQNIDDGLNVVGLNFDEFLAELENGSLYVNVHSQVYRGGEIRGQIPAPPSNLYFATFGNGDGIASDIVLLNSATTGDPVTGSILFFDASGNLLDPDPFLQDSGNPQILSSHLGVPVELPPLGDLTVGTTGSGELVSGSVRVASDQPLDGVIRFTITGIGVTGVNAVPVTTAGIAPVRREGSLDTGLAILNPGADDIVVNASLRQGGAEVENGNVEVPLGPSERVSIFITQLFPLADTTSFSGSVVLTSDAPFSAMALEFDVNGVLTTLPVTPLR